MKGCFLRILVLIVIVLNVSCLNSHKVCREQLVDNNDKKKVKTNYPWSDRVTANAIKAILTSIDNINSSNIVQDDNFPANVNNMPFTQTEKTEFIIVGYESTENFPAIYRIGFKAKNKHYEKGSRITVEIDVKQEEAIRVYMSPDA